MSSSALILCDNAKNSMFTSRYSGSIREGSLRARELLIVTSQKSKWCNNNDPVFLKLWSGRKYNTHFHSYELSPFISSQRFSFESFFGNICAAMITYPT